MAHRVHIVQQTVREGAVLGDNTFDSHLQSEVLSE